MLKAFFLPLVFLFAAGLHAQTFQMDTLYFENFQNLDNGQMPDEVVVYDNDTCDFSQSGGQTLIFDYFRTGPKNSQGDTCVEVRSDFNMFPPANDTCQANDWLILNQPIVIGPHTMLKWWYKSGADSISGPSFTESYGIYLADTILPNNANNFLSSPVLEDTLRVYYIRGNYDSLDLSAYQGQRKYIGFRYYSTYKSFLDLDDILVVNKIPVSIQENEAFAFSLYPNPSNELLNVQTPAQGTAFIFNHLGQLVAQHTINGNQTISLRELPAGIYTLRFVSEAGSLSRKIQKI